MEKTITCKCGTKLGVSLEIVKRNAQLSANCPNCKKSYSIKKHELKGGGVLQLKLCEVPTI